MWADLGFWRSNGDDRRRFHIHGVTGPDEYTTVVNDNLFTNVMARFNLRRGRRRGRARSASADPRGRTRSWSRGSGLGDDEVEEWRRVRRRRCTSRSTRGLGIHPQDDVFLDREVWDLREHPDGSCGRCCCTTTRW